MTTTRDDTPPALPPRQSEQEGTAPTNGAVPMLTTEQRLERIEAKLDELVAALSTVSAAAGAVGHAVSSEGLAGLVKMLPVLMRGG